MTEFIGRTHELRTCLDLLHSPDLHGAIVDVVGVNGIGKSMFIERLAELAKEDCRARVFRMDMREYGIGEGYSGEFGQNASTSMLRETLAKSKEMLGRLIEVGSREFAEFRALSRLGGIEIDRQQAYNTIQFGSDAKIDSFQHQRRLRLGLGTVRPQAQATGSGHHRRL
jgi:hypothetical protein